MSAVMQAVWKREWDSATHTGWVWYRMQCVHTALFKQVLLALCSQVHTKNGGNWGYKRPLLTNPDIKPTPDMLRDTAAITRQLLSIRYDSPLFRLPSTQVRQLAAPRGVWLIGWVGEWSVG
jgi:hypothetical protein